jgi:CheY-like chemotaxis protein
VKTILIVEDDSAITLLIQGLLEDEGYGVLTAADGRQGLARLRGHDVDLIITDIMMPIVSGVELARRLRADPRYRHLPVIATSGAMQPETAIRRLFTAFLAKPFRLADLLAAVQQCLGEVAYAS